MPSFNGKYLLTFQSVFAADAGQDFAALAEEI
jgi:hypothetical protein